MNFSAGRQGLTSKPRVILMLLLGVLASALVMWQKTQSPSQKHIEAGVRFQQNKQGAEAVQQWREAVNLDPSSEEAWELLGDYSLSTKDYPAAREAFERLSKLDDSIPDLQERLALCELQLQDYPAAHKSAEKALKQTPQSIVALQVLAEVEKQSGDADARLTHLQQLVKLQPQSAGALTDLINEMGKRQDYDKAIPLADRLISMSPDSPSAYYLRGLALFSANPDENSLIRAKADFQKVLRLEPANVEAHRYLGRIYLQQNQPRLAITQFEAVGRGRPYASAHLLELSNAYRQSGNQRRADELRTLFTRLNQFNAHAIAGRKAIELRPNNVENYLQLVLLLNHGMESDENFYQLYRYRYLEGELQSIDFYLEKATQLQPRSKKIQDVQKKLEFAYSKYIKTGLQALRRHQEQSAGRNLGRAALLRPNDERTLDALRQAAALNLNLFGINTAPLDGSGSPFG